jgi:hypothetical protein
LSEQKTQPKNRNKLLVFIGIIVIIGILGGVLIFQNIPTSNVIVDFEFPAEPDTLYYEEFTVRTSGTLQIKLSCSHGSGNLLWYIMDCDSSTYLNLNVAEGEFYDYTYKSNIQGGNPVSDTVSIEAGTYTFVYVQTAGSIGEQVTTAKVVFSPSS